MRLLYFLLLISITSFSQVNDSSFVKTYIVDDYPIDVEMFRSDYKDAMNKIKIDKLISIEQIWYTNKKESLVFNLATDFHKFYIYHFNNKEIPNDFYNYLKLHTEKGEIASNDSVKKHISSFIDKATLIDSHYFRSKKGFELGSSKERAVATYGNGFTYEKKDSIEKLEWEFEGDDFSKTDIKTPKIKAKNSFGNTITMYFRNDELIAMVLFNDIP